MRPHHFWRDTRKRAKKALFGPIFTVENPVENVDNSL